MNRAEERDYLGKAIEVSVRLVLVFAVVVAAFFVVSPFFMVVLWGTILAITFHPIYEKMRRAFGGRRKLAGATFVVVVLALIVVPTLFLSDSLLDATVGVIRQGREGTLEIPPPNESVRSWPVIGEKAWELWQGAHDDLRGTAQKLQPQLRQWTERVVAGVGDVVTTFLMTLLAIVISGILMVASDGISRAAQRVALRLGGQKGAPMLNLIVGTVRSVVKGVVLVALIQSLLAAVGLIIAGVPGAGLWSLLVLMVAIMQLPPLLVLGPIIPWVFANNDSTAIAVFFTIWSLVVSGSDGFLKPILLGRGVDVPMLVILIGAIGGMLQSGVIGLFVGPVILATFYRFFVAWIEDSAERNAAAEAD